MNDDELREAFAALPPLLSPITTWDEHRHTLRRHVMNDYPARFMRWKPIRGTIAIRCDGYIADERRELDEDERDWSKVIIEPGFGDNLHVCEDGTSGGLVHQAYHLKQWLDISGKDVSELRRVFEIGAGYGAMPLIFERMGFTGDYYIKDLPEMELLCQYYLSNVATIQPIFDIPPWADLVIGLHSWGEIPIDERYPFERVQGEGYLIAYKYTYNGMDNTGYFKEFRESRPELEWHHWQPEYKKGGRWYLVGVNDG